MTFGLPFMVLADGSEEFEIMADDDTFVFINGKLVIDMSGIRSATTGIFKINEEAEVYAGVEGEGLAYTGVNSRMALNMVEGTDTVEYDPTNPGYVAPLGTNLTVGLDQAKMSAAVNTVKGMSFGLIAVCGVAIICAAVRYWRRRHNRE